MSMEPKSRYETRYTINIALYITAVLTVLFFATDRICITVLCLMKSTILVSPETKSQGLFHQIQEEVTFCRLLHGADA